MECWLQHWASEYLLLQRQLLLLLLLVAIANASERNLELLLRQVKQLLLSLRHRDHDELWLLALIELVICLFSNLLLLLLGSGLAQLAARRLWSTRALCWRLLLCCRCGR